MTGLSHGADAYLAKPFNEKELFIRLNQLVLLRKKLVDKIQKYGLNKFLDKRAESPETKFLQKAIQLINEDLINSAFGSSDLADKLHMILVLMILHGLAVPLRKNLVLHRRIFINN